MDMLKLMAMLVVGWPFILLYRVLTSDRDMPPSARMSPFERFAAVLFACAVIVVALLFCLFAIMALLYC